MLSSLGMFCFTNKKIKRSILLVKIKNKQTELFVSFLIIYCYKCKKQVEKILYNTSDQTDRSQIKRPIEETKREEFFANKSRNLDLFKKIFKSKNSFIKRKKQSEQFKINLNLELTINI